MPFIKGRLTIFVFQKRYDYGEIGTVLEQREIPTDSARPLALILGCRCLCLRRAAEEFRVFAGRPALLGNCRRLCGRPGRGIRAASGLPRGPAGPLPCGSHPKDPLVRSWDERIPASLAECKKPDDFMNGAMHPEDGDVLSYAFVRVLMGNNARFNTLLTAVHSGTPFEQAFAKAFGGTPGQLAMNGVGLGGSKKGR